MHTQAETEDALREMSADFTTYVREAMVRDGRSVASMALVTTDESLAVLTVLDVTQRLSMFRDAVTQLGATGLVFVHDGWVSLQDGGRTDALLVLWASKWGNAEGAAHCYTHTPFGMRFSETIPAAREHLEPYLRVFAPVENP